MDKDTMKPGMMGQGMMDMCKMMMGKSVVATSDGGVVVLMGNKLQKYDKNLELKKEVEIKVDMESMRKMKKQMMSGCKMIKEKTAEGVMDNEGTEKTEEQEAPQVPFEQ